MRIHPVVEHIERPSLNQAQKEALSALAWMLERAGWSWGAIAASLVLLIAYAEDKDEPIPEIFDPRSRIAVERYVAGLVRSGLFLHDSDYSTALSHATSTLDRRGGSNARVSDHVRRISGAVFPDGAPEEPPKARRSTYSSPPPRYTPMRRDGGGIVAILLALLVAMGFLAGEK